MGLYSNRQSEMFYLPGDWKAIGYQVIEPRSLMISEGENVVIERPDANSRNLLEGILLDNSKRPLNLVRTEVCFNDEAQLSFVASKVKQLVFDEGVSPEEIVIINLISSNNKNQMLAIQRALMQIGVRSVIPGYVESSDVFKPKGFVTISTPFRAKGNEANIVFVINAHRLSNDFTLRMRNAFFVAVTRSRGWCYISGVGAGMEPLVSEIEAIKRDFPRFCFICPSREQVDSSKTFLGKSDKELDEIQRLVDLVDQNPELRALLLRQPDEK
ncbi:MAG: hypothetical protein A2883_16695 [Pseudomonadales bacterium RIFCSPHIGHO2_01_FULL_64_12]|nr:MAG: hypothetical protein A2883_16695 [Pseudomonadales bacterium RIFCSPHIGHO2_01_FULL_64_12]